ncbi:hypothetical protein SAMN05421874_103322 [Nonomuraea maritima]|uniref:Uncharacterized protein n=1 Tax=Nonomuraea maritima TaxID=683260 RepID=A0A1G8WW25_9ACTN|nr:hypothetical protein [Nonomuraea maritima]SDJ82589.1 hypothetical protein SAMN05421874_103322 [Nonomuraea maritima]
MRTPPHLPARPRREQRDTEHVRRHPYGRHERPAPVVPSGSRDFAADVADVADVFVEQRLLDIREMSNQAIGSIDDLLHTA